jgi:hypothetical protein
VDEVGATRDLSLLYVHEYGASPNTFHTQVLKAAIEETCLYSYVYIVRIQMEVPECELGGSNYCDCTLECDDVYCGW